MYPDFKELLSALNAHHVKYLVVGGYAVSIHAQPRATKDLDILVKPEADNARAAYAAHSCVQCRESSRPSSGVYILSRTKRRHECRRGTHECVRHGCL